MTDSETWEIATTVGTEEEASLVAGFLEAEGIAARVQSLLFHQEPVNFGGLGEVRVLVDGADVERARDLLAARADDPPNPVSEEPETP